jgi:hypothetical protein
MQQFKKIYRIQHQRCIGTTAIVVLQDRLIEAETAEQALQKVLPLKHAPIQVDDENQACLEQKKAGSSDLWTAFRDDLS